MKFDPPTETGVSKDDPRLPERAAHEATESGPAALLDDRGKASVIAFLPATSRQSGCEVAIRRVARQVIPVRRFKIEQVSVTGRSATANVEGTDPPYSSGVLLANRGDGWKISYPPGLQAKSGKPPPGRGARCPARAASSRSRSDRSLARDGDDARMSRSRRRRSTRRPRCRRSRTGTGPPPRPAAPAGPRATSSGPGAATRVPRSRPAPRASRAPAGCRAPARRPR